jgi:hypothetical protein
MSTTTTFAAPQGSEDPRRGDVRRGPVGDGPVGDGPVGDGPVGDGPAQDEPAKGSWAGSWAYALAGMDCYGYGLGFDYWTALDDAAGRVGDRGDPGDRGGASAPSPWTGRTVALVVVGLVAAAAVVIGLVVGLGGHAPAPAPVTAASATTDTGTGSGTEQGIRVVPPAHPAASVAPPAQPSVLGDEPVVS